MTKFCVTYHEVDNMSRRMVLNFGSFEVYKSASYMYVTLATEFFNRSIWLSAHIDMAWLPWNTMWKPFMSRHMIYWYIIISLQPWEGLVWVSVVF